MFIFVKFVSRYADATPSPNSTSAARRRRTLNPFHRYQFRSHLHQVACLSRAKVSDMKQNRIGSEKSPDHGIYSNEGSHPGDPESLSVPYHYRLSRLIVSRGGWIVNDNLQKITISIIDIIYIMAKKSLRIVSQKNCPKCFFYLL